MNVYVSLYIPLVGSSRSNAGDSGGAFPLCALLVLPVVPRDRTCPFRALCPLVVVLATAAAQPGLAWLIQTPAPAHAVDETLRDGFIKPLPVLLGDENSSKHGEKTVAERESVKSAVESHGVHHALLLKATDALRYKLATGTRGKHMDTHRILSF